MLQTHYLESDYHRATFENDAFALKVIERQRHLSFSFLHDEDAVVKMPLEAPFREEMNGMCELSTLPWVSHTQSALITAKQHV